MSSPRKTRGCAGQLTNFPPSTKLLLILAGALTARRLCEGLSAVPFAQFGVEQGDLTLFDENEDHTAKTLVRSMVSSNEQPPVHLNRNLLGWIQINKKPLRVNDSQNDVPFRNVDWEETIHSLLSAPLLEKYYPHWKVC